MKVKGIRRARLISEAAAGRACPERVGRDRGLMRALDYLGTDPAVDAGGVAIMGISRLRKTLLWAGARATRFAMVIGHPQGTHCLIFQCDANLLVSYVQCLHQTYRISDCENMS